MEDERALLLRFLLKKLQEAKSELYVSRAVMLNLPDDLQASAVEWAACYRESGELQARVEKEFRAFYELLEQYPQESHRFLEMLKNWTPNGDPN